MNLRAGSGPCGRDRTEQGGHVNIAWGETA